MTDDGERREPPRTARDRSPATEPRPDDADTAARYAAAARATAEAQREIQDRAETLRHRREERREEREGAVQTGAREHPEPPLPPQHLEKPGLEAELQPRPQYAAPDYKGSEKLQDMAAIVTGGDSGIGRAVAVLFAREGADVAVVYLDEDRDAEETKSAVEREGRRALLLAGDVTDPEFCKYAVDRTLREFGRLDILVNNAAFQEHTLAIEDLTEEHFDRTIKTNLYGYFHMAKAALPHMKAGASILNTGSVTGLIGQGRLLDYSATKGAIHAFTKSLAENVIERGIRVNAVAPGPVWTPLNPADIDAEQVPQFGASVLMKRPAQPEEISPAYVFLASPVCSSYITGEVLPILGGMSGG